MTERITDKLVSPVVKWVGGKRQLLKEIDKHLPEKVRAGRGRYYEPFIGGGAVLFHLQPEAAVINDNNEELVNLYRVIQNSPEELIADLRKHRNNEDYFYEIRGLDRNPGVFSGLTDVERASRIVYLNKTCYNGLFRVNSAGEFNTPFGRYRNPNIVNEVTIRAVHNYLSRAGVGILNEDFEAVVENAEPDSFVYFDPPYDPVSQSANFTGYTRGGFGREEQLRLRDLCIRLTSKGVKFLLSNSATEFIQDIYSGFSVDIIAATRAVNSKADKRGAVEEVLVRNYEL